MKQINSWIALLLLGLAMPALWPFYQIGLPETADGALHLLRLVALDAYIEQGIFFPRWVSELFLGYGYPLFNFYGPSTYYLAELLHLLGLGHSYALIGAFALLIVLAGYGAYLLALDLFTQHSSPENNLVSVDAKRVSTICAALLAAVAYMYTPYFLTNIYLRGAIGEVGAQALLPWIFWSFRRLFLSENPQRYVLPAALALGGLAITHNITLLFVPPILLAYICLVGWHHWKRLVWSALAGLFAMGISTFFWLPLLLEREYLSDVAYEIAATYLAENVWAWHNFLDLHWPFEYTLSVPFQLGILQIALVLVGLLVGKRTYEWWFWLSIISISCLAITQWALPIWLNNSILLIAQFPWRLLSIASLPLALWAGRSVLLARGRSATVILSSLLILMVILTHRPMLSALTPLLDKNIDLHLANIAQFEKDTNAFGTSSASEFKPRWARSPFAPQAPETNSDKRLGTMIDLQIAGPSYIQANFSTAEETALYFTNFYYPGWRVTLDDRPLETYPDPVNGLLTVTVPAGEGVLIAAWRGTFIQHVATAITLLTLALMSLFLWRNRQRCSAYLPLVFLLLGIVATLQPTATRAEIQPLQQRQILPNLELLGLRTQLNQSDTPSLTIYPYWFVADTLPDLQITWSLMDLEGTIFSQVTAMPYFNSISTNSWPRGTLVDDAYLLTLPPGLAAGEYQVGLQLDTEGEALAGSSMIVGEIMLPATPPIQPDSEPPLARYRVDHGDTSLLLDRYEVTLNHQQMGDHEQTLVARPNEQLIYTLYWRADGRVPKNYHSFIHFVDRHQSVLMQRDQLPGPMFQPPLLWDRFYARPDRYHFTIPEDSASGLYSPHVGLYGFDDQDRLDIYDQTGGILGNSLALSPIKVVNTPTQQPEIALEARWGEMIELRGYTIETAQDGLQAGSFFTLTLHYGTLSPMTIDYTQFIHLYDPISGMAAQHDTQPAVGRNPTSSWVQDEVVVERIFLNIGVDAVPGSYRLQMGFYDAQTGGVRLPVYGRDGALLLDAQVILTELEILR